MLEIVYILVSLAMVVMVLVAVRVAYRVLGIIRAQHQWPRPSAWPPVTLIIPCKGAEEGLAEHLQAHFQHDYPDYEILFSVADGTDPAVAVIQSVIAANPQVPASVVVAPRLPRCVEKISNQLTAVEKARPSSLVLVFADSDGLPCDRGWLRALVAPALEHTVVTGFRWYFPTDRSWVGISQLAWDSTWCVYHAYAGTVWGGAMACTRANFDQLQLRDYLSRGLTDDLVFLARCQAVGGTVCFAPGAMVASTPHEHWSSFLRWILRQSLIVRLVTPRLWLKGFLYSNLHALFYGLTPLILLWPGEILGRWLPGVVFPLVLILTTWRSDLRYRIMTQLFPDRAEAFRWMRWRCLPFILLTDLLGPLIAYTSLLTRTVRWRGVAYRLEPDGVVRLPAPSQSG